MSRVRSAAEIVAAWQTAIERDVEVGRTPRLTLGAPGLATDATAALLALQTATVQRTDVTAPWLMIGGADVTWLAALLSPLPRGGAPLAPEPVVVFGGADDATNLAMWAMTAQLDTAPDLAPRLHAGAPPRREAWPLLEAGDPREPFGCGPLLDRTVRERDPAADWTVWGVMLLALCLVLSALLL